MSELTLIIGNKNYSSWSLRPWLLLKQAGIPFRERYIPIRHDAWFAQIHALSPSGRAPALHDGSIHVWDSLAICECLAERFFGEAAVVAGRAGRCEMHSAFRRCARTCS